MKNWKGIAAGFVAGAVSMISVTALASNAIQAYLMNDAYISVDGQFVTMPEDQGIINYNSRIYVPIRFLSEQLGADVDWDSANRFATIKSNPKIVEKEVIKEVEKIVYVDADEADDSTKVYKTLPLTYKTSDYSIQITGCERRTAEQATKVFLSIKNTGNTNIELRYRYATLVVDGEEYKLNTFNEQDTGFMNSFSPDMEEDYDGFIYFDMVPEDFENCELKLVLRTDTADVNSDKDIHFNFRIKK